MKYNLIGYDFVVNKIEQNMIAEELVGLEEPTVSQEVDNQGISEGGKSIETKNGDR